MHMGTGACMWKPENNLQRPSGTVQLFFLETGPAIGPSLAH